MENGPTSVVAIGRSFAKRSMSSGRIFSRFEKSNQPPSLVWKLNGGKGDGSFSHEETRGGKITCGDHPALLRGVVNIRNGYSTCD